MPDYSLRVIAKNNPLEEPLLDTKSVKTIEIRDNTNTLVALILLMPPSPVMIISRDDQEDFDQVAKNLGIKITEQ
jgi:hypothetical protein